MAALDIITFADLALYKPITGADATAIARWGRNITDASRLIEGDLGRRIVYRAPPEVLTLDNILSTAFANGTPAGSQPNAAGRTLVVNFPSTATAGTVAVTGTVAGVAGTTETFDVADGLVQHGLKFFSAISGVVIAGAVGGGTLRIGTSLGYVDYHRRRRDCPQELASREWPRVQTNELNEDAARAFGTTTKLVEGTGFLLTRRTDGDFLVRLSSSLPIAFLDGWRSVKDVYSGGYRAAQVPEDIKGVCRRLAILLHDEVEHGRIEVATGSGPLGSWSRFGPATMTRTMRAQLARFRRNRFGTDTAEPDYDLEAA